MESIKIGDTITMDVPVYRRWWEFWRPRIVGQRRAEYRVTGTYTA